MFELLLELNELEEDPLLNDEGVLELPLEVLNDDELEVELVLNDVGVDFDTVDSETVLSDTVDSDTVESDSVDLDCWVENDESEDVLLVLLVEVLLKLLGVLLDVDVLALLNELVGDE